MSAFRRFWQWFTEWSDDAMVYFATVAGILFSNAIPLLKSNESFELDMGKWRIAAAAFVAFTTVRSQEKLTADDKGNTAAARAGRRARFWDRLQNAAAQGFMWSQISNLGA